MANYTDNYNLVKPTMAETADIRTINGNMDTVDTIMHDTQVSMADAFDSTASYAIRDLVMYEFKLYQCIHPHEGPWDAENWIRVNAAETGGNYVEITPTYQSGLKIADTNIDGDQDEIDVPYFGGATAQQNGTGGAVPAPTSSDVGKFLSSNGGWETPSGGGGGTTVIPNPVGEPTDELETVQIGNTIFSISGSSGGGSTAKRTVLYSGTEIETGVIELSDDISNYDIIEVVLGFTGTADKAKGSCYISAEWLLNNCSYTQNPTNATVHWLPSLFDNTFTRIIMGNTNNKLQAFDRVGQVVTEVAGIKFGSGGGKGSGDGYSSTKIWDYVDDNNGTIPYGTYSVTLNDDINNYDMIIAELVSIAGDLNESNWRGTNLFYIDVNSVNNSLESNYINYTTYGDRSARYHIEDTTFAIVTNSGNDRAGLVRVWGIKYGGGNYHVYDSNEKLVGEWFGEPLYEKTVVIKENGTDNYTYSSEVYQNCLPVADFINITQMYAARGDTVGYVDVTSNQNEVYYVPNKNGNLFFKSSHSPTDIIVTVQYTKPTV